MPIRKGERLRSRSTGKLATAAEDQRDGGLSVRQDDGGTSIWQQGDIERLNPLSDFIENTLRDIENGTYAPTITPQNYGFDTAEEYWEAIRRLAGM